MSSGGPTTRMYSDKKTAMNRVRSIGRQNFLESRSAGQEKRGIDRNLNERRPRWFLPEGSPLECDAPFRRRLNPQQPGKKPPWFRRAEIRAPSPCLPCEFAASAHRPASVLATSDQLDAALHHHSRSGRYLRFAIPPGLPCPRHPPCSRRRGRSAHALN